MGNNEIYIQIKALLKRASDAEIKKLQADIQSKIKPLQLKTNIEKTSREYKTLENGTIRLVAHSKTFTNHLGEQVLITRKLNEETGKFERTQLKKLTQEQKITDQFHRQTLAQKDLLTQIRGLRGKEAAFITDDNLNKLNELEQTVKNLDPTSKQFDRNILEAKSNLKAINTDIGIFKKQVQDASKFTNIFGQSLLEAGKKFAGWMVIATLIMQPIRMFRQGIQDLKDIDEQLTQLRKVTGENIEVMRDFAFQANEIAINMGKTTAEIIEQTVAWARLGYSIEQAAKLSEQSTLLSIVGNMDIDRATTALVSTIKAYDIAVEDTERIIDQINEVGNNFAISQEDIAEILERSSAAMREANNSLAETIALATGAQEIQQDAARVGTALRTVSIIYKFVA